MTRPHKHYSATIRQRYMRAHKSHKEIGAIYGEISEALEGRGWVGCTNATAIGRLADCYTDMQERVKLLQGAIDAQDERERTAGARCAVPYDTYGCDWPEAVADELIAFHEAAKLIIDSFKDEVKELTAAKELLTIRVTDLKQQNERLDAALTDQIRLGIEAGAKLGQEIEKLKQRVDEQVSEAIRWRGEHETAVHKLAIADMKVRTYKDYNSELLAQIHDLLLKPDWADAWKAKAKQLRGEVKRLTRQIERLTQCNDSEVQRLYEENTSLRGLITLGSNDELLANAELGKLVRQMPESSVLYHADKDSWRYADGAFINDALGRQDGKTPEEALHKKEPPNV